MKRLSLILLTCIYALSTCGIVIKEFYCCGKLASVDFSFEKEENEQCGKGLKKDGCCKTTHHFIKVKDAHIASAEFHMPAKHFSELFLISPSFKIATAAAPLLTSANRSHAPPFIHNVPVYVFNCIYLI